MDEKMSILDEKYVNFKKWVNAIADKRGSDSTLTINQIRGMLDLLDRMEKKINGIILAAFPHEEVDEIV